MNHESEFDTSAKTRDEAEARRKVQANIISRTYARVFSTDDGKAVLEDLQKKFGHARDRFTKDNNFSTVGGAMIDGQCQVLREIEGAISTGLS